MSDKAKFGYLAAMIDGEGFISISKGSKPAPNGNGYVTAAPRYNLIVSVTGTSEKLMNWLVDNFGGSWSRDKRPLDKPTWKPRVSWRCNGVKNKEILLLATLPYLIIKRDQAILGLDMLRMNGEQNPSKREELFLKMKGLNKRGASVEANMPDCSGVVRKSCGGIWRWTPDKIEPVLEQMIESGLIGDNESVPPVTATT